MARLPAGRIHFFRISPAQAGQARCFAIHIADASERFDARHHAVKETLRSAFPIATLGDLVSVEPAYGSSQRALPRTSESQPRYIRITDFGDDGIEPGHEFTTLDAPERKHELELNDLLFARTGSVGKTYLHEDMSEPAVFAGYCIRFRFDAAKVLPEYVYWWTKTDAYARWVNAIQRPSVQANINKEEFKRCPIPLPSLAEQRQFASVMANARAERKAKLAEADALLSGLDDFVLIALGIAPPQAENRRVFAVRLGESTSSRRLNADYYHPERLAALRALADAANEGELRVAPLDDLAEFARNQIKSPADNYLGLTHIASHTGELTGSEDVASGACWTFETGDVLYARLRPYLNKVYRAEMDGCCSTEFHVLRVKDADAVLPDYLAAALRSRLALAQTTHMMTGNTHPRLTDDDVRALPIPVPPMPTQRRIVAETQRRRAEARRLRGEAEAGWVAAKEGFEAAVLG